jgi:ubiquinone/menaquinone biosynthesis C-methylase UbiE
MKTNYNLGELVYEPNFYDGLNTFLFDLEFYKKWLPKEKDAKILELCCGTGRLTIPIAKAGYDITGVDFTISMLEHAKIKTKNEGLEIDFIEADIRTLNIPEQYDFIFIPFNSIHHLYQNEDLFKTFEVVKKHLKKDGLFIFDCYNPNIEYIVEASKDTNKIAEYITKDGRKIIIKQNMQYENATQINRIKWHYYINDKFDSIQNMDMRLYFPQELNAYLENNGFTIIQKFGGFEEEAFKNISEKQIFICKLF